MKSGYQIMICVSFKAKKFIFPLFIMLCISLLFISFSESIGVFGSGEREIPIYSVERDDNKIALTFNCAWGASDIDDIISTLKEYNAQATFFVVGEWGEKFPEELKKLHDAGFEIGNHSYNHAHYTKLSKSEILEDIEKSDRVIENMTKEKPHLFRAAYGEYNNDVVTACKESGRTYIQWSVDSIDYKATSAKQINDRVLSKVSDGDIILMHTGTDYTAEALKTLLPNLSKNHTLVKVSDLIYEENYTIDHTGRQFLK